MDLTNTYFSHVVASNLKTYLDFEYEFAINTYFWCLKWLRKICIDVKSILKVQICFKIWCHNMWEICIVVKSILKVQICCKIWCHYKYLHTLTICVKICIEICVQHKSPKFPGDKTSMDITFRTYTLQFGVAEASLPYPHYTSKWTKQHWLFSFIVELLR